MNRSSIEYKKCRVPKYAAINSQSYALYLISVSDNFFEKEQSGFYILFELCLSSAPTARYKRRVCAKTKLGV